MEEKKETPTGAPVPALHSKKWEERWPSAELYCFALIVPVPTQAIIII